jgi:hypothetical protein
VNKQELARFALEDPDGEPFDHKEREWKWFGTLTFPDRPSHTKAHRLYHRWFSQIEDQEGIQSLNWVRVTETRLSGIRFHVLLGGARIRNKWDWIVLWHELGGEGSLFYYRPEIFFHYLLNKGRADSQFDMFMSIGGCFWIFPDWLCFRF